MNGRLTALVLCIASASCEDRDVVLNAPTIVTARITPQAIVVTVGVYDAIRLEPSKWSTALVLEPHGDVSWTRLKETRFVQLSPWPRTMVLTPDLVAVLPVETPDAFGIFVPGWGMTTLGEVRRMVKA